MTADVPGLYWRAVDGLHVDTRGLDPPEPMVAILWHIEKPDQTGPITIYLDRDPIFLFPELEDRGWQWEYKIRNPSEVRLILRAKR